MAFSFVRTTQAAVGAVTSVTVTLSGAATQGNLLVINLRTSAPVTNVTVTDNASTPNTYVQATIASTAIVEQRLFYGVQVTGGATQVTIAWTGTTNARPTVDEFSGGAQSNAAVFDLASNANGVGTAISTTLSPTKAGELVVAGITNVNSGGTMTVGAGYTPTNSNNINNTMYKLNGTTSETPSATLTVSQTWVICAAAFKEPVVNTGATTLLMGV